MAKLKAGVLISGSGTNLQALLDAAAKPDYPVEIVLVISNKGEAYGLERAQAAGVATVVINHRDFDKRERFDDALDAALRDAGCDLVCLAGFMRLLTAGFVEGWNDRLINIHPSLLPSFRGLDAQAQALAAGVRIAGCSVHFVRAKMDVGPIIMQATVPVLDDDDADKLSARILEVEHRIYPLAVRLIGEGRVTVEGDMVRISGDDPTRTDSLISPGRDSG
ncbi:MAG: phosphoribosylglycinamide formyltransferase [Alphaproteobacteria bacterium]|nr:phosphoribosylglycinamide formyltransferase [Alphaproteobacteria bacterium]